MAGRLVRIRRDYGGGNVQLAYEYGYGFDGGRRWRKDYLNGIWTRYPCGVACGAGDLVEQQKPLEGGSWTTSALYLQGISLVRRNNEWHHFDPLGTAQVITNNSAQVVSNNVYDVFGVLRYQQGSAQTPWRWKRYHQGEENGLFSRSRYFPLALGHVVVGAGVILVYALACRAIAEDVNAELMEWRDQTPEWHPDRVDEGKEKDKLLHCVATCLIYLRAGLPCAFVAAFWTERGGGGVHEDADERANVDGLYCGRDLKRKQGSRGFNDWPECHWCCRQKGYRPR